MNQYDKYIYNPIYIYINKYRDIMRRSWHLLDPLDLMCSPREMGLEIRDRGCIGRPTGQAIRLGLATGEID